MEPITNIIQLRQFLSERLPHARIGLASSAERRPGAWPTGLAQLDELLQGGLPKSALAEIVSHQTSSGSALLICAFLGQALKTRSWVALIDGADSFDPASLHAAVLSQMLWVRCSNARQAVQAADLLLRDGNLPLVLLDLKMNPGAELQKVPSSAWHRFQRLVETTSATLVVFTPRALVGRAQIRLSLPARFTLQALEQARTELLDQICFKLERESYATSDQPLIASAG